MVDFSFCWFCSCLVGGEGGTGSFTVSRAMLWQVVLGCGLCSFLVGGVQNHVSASPYQGLERNSSTGVSDPMLYIYYIYVYKAKHETINVLLIGLDRDGEMGSTCLD